MQELKKEIKLLENPEKAKILQRFFKTGKGEYGEGDTFVGIVVPEIRKLAKKYNKEIEIKELKTLTISKIHEERLLGFLILIEKYKKDKKEAYDFYLKHIKYINNWDLVDLTCRDIIGAYLYENKDYSLLFDFANSKDLWKKRISIISTFYFIAKKEFNLTIEIAEILINDKEDLIQKAVGWMLREIGKRDLETEENFLIKHYKTMPRTALRYAIEKFSPDKKEFYMNKKLNSR